MTRGPVRVVPYDPGWPASFQALRTVLAAALGDVARAIHHVGSTAVPSHFCVPSSHSATPPWFEHAPVWCWA
jgi:GrpB-like predicted nucleotidyltransferase (UPF0157 family)